MTKLNKIAVAVAFIAAAQGASAASVSANTTLASAIAAIGDAYDAFGATTSEKSAALTDIQELVNLASAHGTYEDASVTFSIGNDGAVTYRMDITTHDNEDEMEDKQEELEDQIQTDFFGGAGNSYSALSVTKTGSTWAMTGAGTVLSTWASADGGVIDELQDLQDAIDDVTEGNDDITALKTAIGDLDDSVDVLTSGFDDIDEALADVKTGTDSDAVASTYANWGIGRSAYELDISSQGTNYTLFVDGDEETDLIANYYLDNVTADGVQMSIGSDTWDDLNDYICDTFDGTDC